MHNSFLTPKGELPLVNDEIPFISEKNFVFNIEILLIKTDVLPL